MRAEPRQNFESSSWPKTVVRKWLNLGTGAHEFQSDSHGSKGTPARRKSCSDEEGGLLTEGAMTLNGPDPPKAHGEENLRMFVGTWNVGGRAPHGGLDLSDWLTSTPSPADIFVLGFQEIVPLTAGNVLGAEDKGPAATWLSIIRRALNSRGSAPVEPDYHPVQKSRVSFSDLLCLPDRAGLDGDNDVDQRETSSNSDDDDDGKTSPELSSSTCGREFYYLAASKQMVGIFLCVWVRAGIMRRINSIKVSCIGRGVMGFMGNKGSVSISMVLRRTTFCFVCTHLTSGEKDGDEIRRNSDVMEILKRTRFPNSSKLCSPPGAGLPPETILEHEKIIWLGDLNYRLKSTTCCLNIHELLRRNEWQGLLEKDQLKIERSAGKVFAGWEEGTIFFPPTYKYLANSNSYAVSAAKSKEKHRTPAWCDRILWRGKGMKQMWYVRGESRFSDHRPVYSLFSVHLNDEPSGPVSCCLAATAASASASSSNGRVQAEELLDDTRRQSDFSRF